VRRIVRSSMTRPWKTLAKTDTSEGVLELRQRGETDFLIVIGGRVLMNSFSRSSEEELARLACAALANAPDSTRPTHAKGARILIAGLGMGFTLRAALDALAPDARVTICEINAAVVDWCRGPDGPLAPAIRNALADPRVDLQLRDVAAVIGAASRGHFDAIILDLYEGPNAASQRRDDPFYSARAIEQQRAALAAKGVLAVWSEDADAPYAKRLASAGFDVKTHSIGAGGRRHIVYLARR
jgi:spermidine synthase